MVFSGTLSIGFGTVFGSIVTGLIDAVAVWSRTLCHGINICSSNEIYELYRR